MMLQVSCNSLHIQAEPSSQVGDHWENHIDKNASGMISQLAELAVQLRKSKSYNERGLM